MFDQGLLKSKLPVKFFRYHHYHLWDRHICCFLHLWISEKKIWFDDWALYVKKLASFIDDKAIAESIVNEVNIAQRLVILNKAMDDNSKIIFENIEDMHKLHNVELYNMDIVEQENEKSPNVTHLFKTA